VEAAPVAANKQGALVVNAVKLGLGGAVVAEAATDRIASTQKVDSYCRETRRW
jgi:hypothetical protein